MSMEAYQSLIDRICARCDIPNPELMYQVANLNVNKTDFSLYYGGAIDPLSALVYCDFGVLPTESREAILLRLLETNMYMFGVNSPSFTYNPDSGHILMMFRLQLQGATADSALEAFAAIADMAIEWRKGYFLEDEKTEKLAGAKRAGLKGTADRLAARLGGSSTGPGKN
ncbi:MAG TPA: CesT family type III secretion system chaperone [Noviherbaspirillum sp.]|nr:CesT family type III secretion system chaperone [Noviherbaspirillum sp.]